MSDRPLHFFAAMYPWEKGTYPGNMIPLDSKRSMYDLILHCNTGPFIFQWDARLNEFSILIDRRRQPEKYRNESQLNRSWSPKYWQVVQDVGNLKKHPELLLEDWEVNELVDLAITEGKTFNEHLA